MKSKLGIVCMLLGTVLVFGALTLFLSNQKEEKAAENFTIATIPVLREEIAEIRQTMPAEPAEPDPTPIEFLEPEDLVMTETVLDNHSYIGYLRIEALNLELPVMSDWSDELLQISPCRFSGTVKGEDLVIMAHNYKVHFGSLSQLKEGAQVQFVDMDGTVWNYEVTATDLLPATAVEEMTAGDYDLTLFTCTTNRSHRVTVRCDLTE